MAQANGPQHGPPARGQPAALVADGSAALRAAVRDVLERFAGPIDVVEARTGRAAYHALADRRPALAFISLQLDDLSGAEALAFARAQGVPTLAFLMSRLVLPRWVEIATELNAYDFLRTPFDREHVVALLSNWRRMAEPSPVLVVDEAEPVRRHVRGVLASTRFPLAVDECGSAAEALDHLGRRRYAIALFGCQAGDPGWTETAARARAAAPATRLVLMSPDAPPPGEAARRGADAVLRRPFYAPEFDRHFHTLFGLRRPYLLNAVGEPAPGRAGSA